MRDKIAVLHLAAVFSLILMILALTITSGCFNTQDSPLNKVPIEVDMPREQLERLVAKATGKPSDYNIFSMYDQTEATYRDGICVLTVIFKRGYPHGMGLPGQDSIPAIDSTVISWKLTYQ